MSENTETVPVESVERTETPTAEPTPADEKPVESTEALNESVEDDDDAPATDDSGEKEEQPDPNHRAREGEGWKRSPALITMRRWQKRHLRLDGFNLKYYKNKGDPKFLGKVFLRGAQVTIADDRADTVEIHTAEGVLDHKGRSGRKYFIRFSSSDEAKEWHADLTNNTASTSL